ncbi:MAG: VCBS repeat-containing protein, partial [Acidobacteriota bacterium]
VPSNYDGVSAADIAIYRPSNGQWWIKRLSDVIVLTFGNGADKPVPGDYTGDGRSDVAFWRPSTGEWFVLRSENFSFFAFPFGASSDIPAPGDYDGDGKYDATVFRPSSGTWFSQRSTGGILIQQFGVNGDIPIPSAFVP